MTSYRTVLLTAYLTPAVADPLSSLGAGLFLLAGVLLGYWWGWRDRGETGERHNDTLAEIARRKREETPEHWHPQYVLRLKSLHEVETRLAGDFDEDKNLVKWVAGRLWLAHNRPIEVVVRVGQPDPDPCPGPDLRQSLTDNAIKELLK